MYNVKVGLHIDTVRAHLQAAASINFEGLWVQLLFKSAFYLRAACIFQFYLYQQITHKNSFPKQGLVFVPLITKKLWGKK